LLAKAELLHSEYITELINKKHIGNFEKTSEVAGVQPQQVFEVSKRVMRPVRFGSEISVLAVNI
jgi:hypothetical protein